MPPISVISNGLEEDFIHRARSHQRRVVSERLVFAGNLAAYQGLEALLSALPVFIRRALKRNCIC